MPSACSTEDDNAGKPNGKLLEAIRSNTAQAGAASTITLDAGASGTDDLYNEMEIEITGGTGSGQKRYISDYVGSSKIATLSVAWSTTPDATSTFDITNGYVSVPIADISDSSFSEIIKGFLTKVVHAAATDYHIVLRQTGGDVNNFIEVKVDTGGGYANGNVETSIDSGTTWVEVSGEDMYFKLWKDLPTSVNLDLDITWFESEYQVV